MNPINFLVALPKITLSHMHTSSTKMSSLYGSYFITDQSCGKFFLHILNTNVFLLHTYTGTVLSFFVRYKYGMSGRTMISMILINEYNFLANVGDVVVFRIFSASLTKRNCIAVVLFMFNCCASRR